jgi:hypothetical protein
MNYTQLASRESIEKTLTALKANGFDAFFVETGADAKKKVLELIPDKAGVMTMTSVTMDTIKVTEEILESGKYEPVKGRLMTMDKNTQGAEMRAMGTAPDFAVGSVHAVTEEGHVIIASASGSQLPAYAYGAGKVIWVVGAQKIVKNTEEGFKRIYGHSLRLENERALKAYGMGSGVNKILIINKEAKAGRLALILVNEVLGF